MIATVAIMTLSLSMSTSQRASLSVAEQAACRAQGQTARPDTLLCLAPYLRANEKSQGSLAVLGKFVREDLAPFY